MDIQYKPSKPKKEKPVKAPKAPKAEKAMKFTSTVQTVKPAKPAKAPKAPKPEKAKKMTFGKPDKMQVDKPVKVEKPKKTSIFSKIDPKWILGGAVVLIAAIAVVVLTVVLPAIEEHGQQINNITISTTPKKTVYIVGEEVNYTGLRILATRNNGETFSVPTKKCEITGFDSTKAVDFLPITVSYNGFTTSFVVSVEEPAPETSVLTGIRMGTLPKTLYHLGEPLDVTDGVILRDYADGSTVPVNLISHNVSGYSAITVPGTYNLTVTYKENGVTQKTTYQITVDP